MALIERYIGAMVLGGAGDALGYKNGQWEFCNSGQLIHDDLEKLGGLNQVIVSLPDWAVSDDTVMHLATAEALVQSGPNPEKESLYQELARQYKICMNDMIGRSPGPTCMTGAFMLKPNIEKGYCIPFNERGGGCGAAMRSMCIGLRYPRPAEIDDLIAVSCEAGRMTHHNPTGYLGSLTGALFTAYAIQGKPMVEWGAGLMSELPRALNYIKQRGILVEDNIQRWSYFQDHWAEYLKMRGIADGTSDPTFPEKYGIKERDVFYKSLSFSGWGGSSGHDAPMIAYDAMLASRGAWHELCSRAMFHSGDSDSTGIMAASWFGAFYGFQGVPVKNYRFLEYKDRLEHLGEKLYILSHPPQ